MKILSKLSVISLLVVIVSCSNSTAKNSDSKKIEIVADPVAIERNKEAREDSMEMAEALALQAKIVNKVKAVVETAPVQSEEGADAADDPAIWINKKNPEQSLVVGTNKKAGLYVYNLKGEELQFVPVGKVNNADVSYDFNLKGQKIDIIGASNRSDNSIVLFQIDAKTRRLVNTPLCSIASTVDEVYGFCLYHNEKSNEHYAFVNGKNGKIEQWILNGSGAEVTAKLARTFQMNSQPEGMVVDNVTNTLYLGVEEEGIYKVSALPDSDTTTVLIAGTDDSNPYIEYDIEGLTIYRKSDKEGYLIASIQGSFSYAVFDLAGDNKYITSFIINDGDIDGVEETDGLEATATPMGSKFPAGILVVQDGFNKDGDKDLNQNFKVVSFQDILHFIN